MLVAFVLAVLSMAALLQRRNRSAASKIALDDLLLGDDGRISKAAAVMMASLFVTSWVIVYQTITHQLTDTGFAAYLAAWVAPSVAKIIKAA
jgi:hypothetical protein